MAEPQKKTVPFPQKEIPIVDMTKKTLVERFVVPACWLTGGIAVGFILAKVMAKPKPKEMMFVRGVGSGGF